MKCENCGNVHNGDYGSGRFCSSKCARGFSTKNKRQEINEKVSNKLSGRKFTEEHKKKLSGENNGRYGKEPPNKGKKMSLEFRKKVSEGMKGKKLSEETKNKLRVKSKERIKNNKFSGWKTRKKLIPSYPEMFFIAVLKNNNIVFEREKNVGKYFIDFAINDKKIALEIDGKQHELEERKNNDKQKDELLTSLGWKVYRIKWNSIKSEIGKQNIEIKIKKFIDFYYNN